MEPTEEQARAIDLFKTGDSLAIEAGAGTGKTSTLVMLAKTAGNKRGQYVAFNKALVEESRAKFPLTVETNTAHSLAFRAIGRQYAHRLNSSQRMMGSAIAMRIGLSNLEVMTFEGKPKTLYSGFLASLANKTVTNFCQSADDRILPKHVPFVKGLDTMSTFMLREALLGPAMALWTDLQNVNGWVPYKHEHYLKKWQLGDPRIGADFILFDESQDANPVIASIVARQADHAQLVYVGDSQQEIYAWTGAVNALAQVQVVNRTFLTQSFRFGQRIADRANKVLDLLEAPLRLTGNPAIDSRLEDLDAPKAILTRTNAVGVSHMLGYQAEGKTAHLIGGAGELLTFAKSAQELIDTGRTSHPDLVCFDSWDSVRAYVNDQEEGGEDLKLLVRLIDTFGSQVIMDGLARMPTEQRADVVISTAHKSKGREWKTVKLANDFPQQADSAPADLRLLYVAVTRAKEVLDSSILDSGAAGDAVVRSPFEANEAVN